MSRALAKIVTRVLEGEDVMHIRDYTSHFIGVAGAAGVGKSTLISKLAEHYTKKRKKVAIILNDPAKNGALLGDRIRMQNLMDFENVFIRSISADSSGGISILSRNLSLLFEKQGFDIVIIESVGIGQMDMNIYYLCDTLLTVLMPNLGDEIQHLKSGLNEVTDIFVVNKSDLSGAERVAAELEFSVNTREKKQEVVITSAFKGTGIIELSENIENNFIAFKNNNQKKIEKKIGEAKFIAISKLNKKVDDCLARLDTTNISSDDLSERILESL